MRRWGHPIETGAPYVRRWNVGETGSGKSRLLHLQWEQWLRDCPDGEVWVLDLDERLPAPSRGYRVLPEDRDLSARGPHYDFVNGWSSHVLQLCRDDGKPRLLVVDETDQAVRAGDAPPGLVAVVSRGRKESLSWHFACRRWVEIPPLLREQASEHYVFNLDEPRALAACAAMGLDPATVRTLRVGEFVHRVRGRGNHKHAGALSACPSED